MKNTVTMAELMKKVQAYGQPQNLDEGFASDASRRAAFAQGYKAKGKKDKKEETLDEKLSTSQIGTLKKTFEPLRGKKIGPNAQDKLMKIMDKLDKDKDTLGQLVKADIPFVTQLAITRLISKHNMKAPEINKLREETLDEAQQDIFIQKGDAEKIAKQVAKNAKGLGLRSASVGSSVRIIGPKKRVSDFLRTVIGRSSTGDATTSGMTTDKTDKLLQKAMNEETELDEGMKYTHVAVDKKGLVIGFASDEKDAKDMAKRNDGKVIKLKKPMSDKKGDMMVNRPFKEEVELSETIVDFDYSRNPKAIFNAFLQMSRRLNLTLFNAPTGMKDLQSKGTGRIGGTKQNMLKFMKYLNSKGIEPKVEIINEQRSATGYTLFHRSFSDAMQHAYSFARVKMGMIVDPKEIDNKVATGPKKPGTGKTNSYSLKTNKGMLQIQVYNTGSGAKPFELNMYSS